MMKLSALALFMAFAFAAAFVPTAPVAFHPATCLLAKYKTMDEILALFPEDKPILVNFYDAKTEKDIKDDIFRAKTLLKDRATLVSIKQQDYPELAKLWDANEKSPAMILFKDGQPVTRLYGETHYLAIVAKVGQYCRPEGEEHKPIVN
jgi:thioredoxin-like negative regulator of GroEL